jgi:CSLREA domain-containing protein
MYVQKSIRWSSCALLLALAVMPASPTSAATITVTTLEDALSVDGACSLRAAIINANNGNQSGSAECSAGTDGHDTIVFDAALAGERIVLNGTQLPLVDRSLTIQGPVAGDWSGIVIDGDGQSRVLDISGAISVEIHGVTITGGRTVPSGFPGAGMRIFNGVDVHLERVLISDNLTEGGGSNGAGILVGSDVTLSMVESEVRGNKTLNSNSSGGGMAVLGGGSVEIVRSTVIGNESRFGGGLIVRNSSLTMVNSTLSENVTSFGAAGGIYVDRDSSVHLTHVTLAFNLAASGANSIHVIGTEDEPSELYLENSLVVQAEADQLACITGLVGVIHASGSLATHAGCTGTATAVEAIALGPLEDLGGPTLTHSLGPGSVAVDAAGDCVAEYGVNTDQRGFDRPGENALACDIGAYELQQFIDGIFDDRFEQAPKSQFQDLE